MTDRSATKLTFWPFVLVDAFFLALACLIFSYSHRPLTVWESFALILCAALGAWSFLTPFLRRDAAELKLAESQNLTSAVAQIQNLDQIAAQIAGATKHLQLIQEQTAQTVAASKTIADKMTEEIGTFDEFIQKANDSEKIHLRLEVEKLRRAEADWLQILVHILDHVFALHRAAVQSGKPALIQQMGNFQTVCRDAARRMGLVCHVPETKEPFDEKIHQLLEGQAQPENGNGTLIGEILAAGYSYQGRSIRRVLVNLQSEADTESSVGKSEEARTAQETLL